MEAEPDELEGLLVKHWPKSTLSDHQLELDEEVIAAYVENRLSSSIRRHCEGFRLRIEKLMQN